MQKKNKPHVPIRRNLLLSMSVFDDLYSPRLRNRSPISDWPTCRTCVISSKVSVIRASYEVGRRMSLRGRGKVRKRGDVDWLPKAETIVRYLDFSVSEVHLIKLKDSHSSLARSPLVTDHPAVYVSEKVLGWM